MNKKHELIANIILIITGILGGIIFFLIDAQKLCPIFFSIALASILYQFLGGIGDSNKFSLGAIKFGGAAAILIGFMFFLQEIVFVEKQEIYYSNKEWIPINPQTGKTTQLFIEFEEQIDTFPKPELQKQRISNNYNIVEGDNEKFYIKSQDKKEDIGYFDLNDLDSTTLFNNVEIDNNETNIQVFTLYPDSAELNSSIKVPGIRLPFEIQVFDQSRFNFLINDKTIPEFKDREIVSKASYVVPISENTFYIVFLEQASNYVSNRFPRRFSKWIVKRVKKSLSEND